MVVDLSLVAIEVSCQGSSIVGQVDLLSIYILPPSGVATVNNLVKLCVKGEEKPEWQV